MTDLATVPDFSMADIQLEIPGMDGYRADKLALAFSGQVELDRTSSEDVDFVNGLRLYQDVEFRVTATVLKKGFTGSEGGDGTRSTGYGVGLKVHSLEVA